jgi:hypothetical protein
MIFTHDHIRSRLKDEPFVPLRIVTTTGRSFDVYHPDLVWVGRTFLMVGTPTTDDLSTFENVSRVALVRVVELQDLPRPVQPTSSAA